VSQKKNCAKTLYS